MKIEYPTTFEVPNEIKSLLGPLYEVPLGPLQRFGAIYFLISDGEVVYVGQSTRVAGRIVSHLSEGTKKFDRVVFMPVPMGRLDETENQLIWKLKPRYNLAGTKTEVKTIDEVIAGAILRAKEMGFA